MKTKRIYKIGDSQKVGNVPARLLASEFVESPVLHRDRIREVAKLLAGEIREKVMASENEVKISLVVDVLRPNHLLEWLHLHGLDAEEIFSYGEDLGQGLVPIRAAVVEELKNLFPESSVHYVLEKIGRDFWELSDGLLLKDKTTKTVGREAQVEALRILYALPERSPYLSFQIRESDPHDSSDIQRKLKFRTLARFLERISPHEVDRPTLLKALGYVIDAMQGAQFLLEHGLVLVDNTPRNIAIDEKNGKGFLFDFDGLRQRGKDAGTYHSHGEYFPPEAITMYQQGKMIIDEPQVVYEFGICIGEVLYAPGLMPEPKGSKIEEAVFALFSHMTEDDHARRPHLLAAIETLRSLSA